MQNVRRAILYLSSFIGVWLAVSFVGAMFDSGNAAFWSGSLMWALLSFMIIAPGLVFLSVPSSDNDSSGGRTTPSAGSDSSAERTPFVDNETEENETLWPEAEQSTDWPKTESEQSASVRA